MTRGPDFVGVGAESSGEDWWWSLIADHPAVRAPGERELHFFDEFCARAMDDEDIATYHARFGEGDGVRGEWTSRYLYDAWTPPLLRRAAPEARVLVLLRDPLERLRSGLALQFERTPNRRPHLAYYEAMAQSRYGFQLRRLFDAFERDRVLVLQLERCARDPAGEYARTLRFIGADDGHRPAALDRPPPPDGREPRPVGTEYEAELRRLLAADLRELEALDVGIDTALWPSARAAA